MPPQRRFCKAGYIFAIFLKIGTLNGKRTLGRGSLLNSNPFENCMLNNNRPTRERGPGFITP